MNVSERLLSINNYSRPGKKLTDIMAIVIHWTANPNVSAENNRLYFESRKSGKLGYGSAHYIIGLSGETIRCIPENEMAYHVGSSQSDPKSGNIYTDIARDSFGKYASNPSTLSPNQVTIGIELCPIDFEGNFNVATIESAIELCVIICKRFNLKAKDIFTHNQIVGWKDCPKLWVTHPSYFDNFKRRVDEQLSA